jgi:hypothetical protein
MSARFVFTAFARVALQQLFDFECVVGGEILAAQVSRLSKPHHREDPTQISSIGSARLPMTFGFSNGIADRILH